MSQTEVDRIKQAELVINNYAEIIKGQLHNNIQLFKHNNPGHEFHHLDIKYDEVNNVYNIQPKFIKL